MRSFFRIVLIALFFSQGFDFLFSQSSPFRNPNSQIRQRSLPKPNFSPPNLVQKPNKQADHSGEVAFRGYFYLNSKPRFCLFNVKANVSEWITLGSSTSEEFKAVAFHEESETLTVAYKNHPEFNLNLYGPSHALSVRSPSVSRPASIPGKAPAKPSGQPRVMPPVPNFRPALPPSVVSAGQQFGNAPRTSSTGTGPPSSAFGTRVPSPVRFPAFPGPRFPGGTSGQRVPAPTVPVSSSTPISSRPISSVPSTSIPESNPDPVQNPTTNPVTENELDLSTLPPPPPPPNILPPSAPPNIEPSREGQ